jgi:glycosyltransferase involved in cell wall biosynthesis
VDKPSKLRLAFLCAGDPLDVLTWSGTPYHMLEALKGEFEVVEPIRRPWPAWFDFARRAVRRLSNGKIDIYWWPALTTLAAGDAISSISSMNCDVAFVVAASPIGAKLFRRTPVAYVSDATFALMEDYNHRLRRLAPQLKRWAGETEARCLDGATATFLPSDWARDSAIRDHGGDPNKVFVVPWGSNLTPENPTPPEQRSKDKWRLLFIGTDWVGKGGDIALETIAEMRRRGHDVHLDLVGCTPPNGPSSVEGVTFHGFLDKRNPAQRDTLTKLFQSAHAFFLPTQAEALGIVFAEAAAYGLPSISYDTGGISGMVVHGETGLLLPEKASPAAFADALGGLLGDWDGYLKMAHAAPVRAEKVLNWPAWAREVRRRLTELVNAPTAA